MRRSRRFRLLVLSLLLVLLPLRSLLAAGQLTCEPLPQATATTQQQAGHDHHAGHGESHGHAAKPCKLCAPCCLAAAPPPVQLMTAVTTAPAERAARAPAEAWASVVPPLPDPPPRA
ncbi:MAG: hypothetical protein EOP35_24395 [Rubrivivax sp.]|nr:MAG: hypothetical protein EOP35_24395 [Rubrivivax sp.]